MLGHWLAGRWQSCQERNIDLFEHQRQWIKWVPGLFSFWFHLGRTRWYRLASVDLFHFCSIFHNTLLLQQSWDIPVILSFPVLFGWQAQSSCQEQATFLSFNRQWSAPSHQPLQLKQSFLQALFPRSVKWTASPLTIVPQSPAAVTALVTWRPFDAGAR